MNEPLSPREIQAAQLLVGITIAVFIGGRFIPPRYRQTAGAALTVCYLLGFAAFVIYALLR
jgi:hypothetical protein